MGYMDVEDGEFYNPPVEQPDPRVRGSGSELQT